MFSTFDLKSAYHKISRIESDRKYAAFEANGKLYEFTRISLNVKNGVVEFQRKMREFTEEENLNGAFHMLITSQSLGTIRLTMIVTWPIFLMRFSAESLNQVVVKQ